MEPVKQTHMDRELRTFTEKQLKLTEINLLRAERNRALAKEIENQIGVSEQEQKAFDEAIQFREENSFPSKISLSEILVSDPYPLEQSINDLEQTIGAFKFNRFHSAVE